ncbi:MAG: hypothetical protein MZU91_14740 [Desulfosudis oleivorans]|nr:hypothetical protein [Desulfosudis oleivorans]
MRVFAAGRAWHRRGRYGRFIGRPPARRPAPGAVAFSGMTARATSSKSSTPGLNSLTEFGRRTAPQFSLEEMTRRRAGRPAQRPGRDGARQRRGARADAAIGAGCRSVEHGFFMGADNLERMAERRDGLGADGRSRCRPMPRQLAADRPRPGSPRAEPLDHQLAQLQQARRLGVHGRAGHGCRHARAWTTGVR